MVAGEIGRCSLVADAETTSESAASASHPPSPPASAPGPELPPVEQPPSRPLREPPATAAVAKRPVDLALKRGSSMRRTVSNPTLRRPRGPPAPLIPAVGTRCDVVFDRATQSGVVQATGQLRSAPAFRAGPLLRSAPALCADLSAREPAPPSMPSGRRPVPDLPCGPREPPSTLSAASFLATCPGWTAQHSSAADWRKPARTLESGWRPAVSLAGPVRIGQVGGGRGSHLRMSSLAIGQSPPAARHLQVALAAKGTGGQHHSAPRLLPSM
mmetsp:Transcript_8573/g.19231  ORF Transcript_8573/g.19231 Transcript_8573/m.19231 type:complete len:271 (-) Transcript_8573:98-910(-)